MTKRGPIRIMVLLVSLAVTSAGCAGSGDDGLGDDGSVESVGRPATTLQSPTDPIEDGDTGVERPTGPSALDSMVSDEFPDPLIDTTQIISGGPPPDGIPPIDNPAFVSVADNPDILPGVEAVVALEINGDARAYPIRAMVWHEIVNDVVGGVPVAVTYCPLCNSAATYERTIDGLETTFGTSGRLFASALVMYDRATESLWTHFDGKAVVGVLTGTELVSHASPLLSWTEFVTSYPDGVVLDWEAAGFDRDYGRNPYSGYDTPDNEPFLFRGALDDRAGVMQRVVGFGTGADAVALAIDVVSGGEVKVTSVDGSTPAVVFWRSGQASALEDRSIAGGRDIGSVGVFSPIVDDDQLEFTTDGGSFVDVGTGSRWNIAGRAVEGPLVGAQLDAIPHLDTFWFAWSTYQPDTVLIAE